MRGAAALVASLAGILSAASPVQAGQASQARLCRAVLTYVDQAPPEAVFKVWRRISTLECDADQPAATALCAALIANRSGALPNMIPAEIGQCLKEHGAQVTAQATGELSANSLPQVVGLQARLRSGRTVTVDFTPEEVEGGGGHYGLFELVVSSK